MFHHKLTHALHTITETTQDIITTLYHGTLTTNLKDILTNGLDPLKSQYAQDEEDNDYDLNPTTGEWGKLYGPPYHFTFLTTTPAGARHFAPGGNNHQDPNKNNGIVLQINLPPHLQQQLILDRGEYIRAPFHIDPQYTKTPNKRPRRH